MGEEHLRTVQYIFKIMSRTCWIHDFRMCVQSRMNDISKGGVKVCVPCRVTTWLWCELPFIEYLVVELDYGKMSATDLSSFDIAL